MTTFSQKRLVRQCTLCKELDLTHEGLKKLIAKDPTFPAPIKIGDTRQSPVFFDSADIQAWINSKKSPQKIAS